MFLLAILFIYFVPARGLESKDVVFVILSQENKYHLSLAENLKIDIQTQSEQRQDHQPPVVHLTHRDFPHVGGWTILPLIPRLGNLHKANSSWVFFLEDRTKIRLDLLLDVLSKHSPNKEIWLGHGLNDEEATIIHHFQFSNHPQYFKYPNIASGFAVSVALLKTLADRIKRSTPSSDFSIDNSHELALFVWNKGAGQMLQHESALCIREKPHCAAFPAPFQLCGDLVGKNSLYFAVKTCEKYHKDRVEVVKKTWGQHATILKFFSNKQDSSVPTVVLDIPNTEQGHCKKTMGILKYVAKDIEDDPEIQWIVLTDDDTILSVFRMQQLLTCFDSNDLVALGERYGYNVQTPRGYNYITGGGGTVFSRPLLDKLLQDGVCDCPSINTPDDMFLGLCIAGLGVSVTHSPLFHQARPVDYARGYLETEDAVSFHKHWMIDPIKVYKKWFENSDSNLRNAFEVHEEL